MYLKCIEMFSVLFWRGGWLRNKVGIDRCMPLSITLRASAMAVAGRLSSVFPCDFRGQIDYYGEEEAKKTRTRIPLFVRSHAALQVAQSSACFFLSFTKQQSIRVKALELRRLRIPHLHRNGKVLLSLCKAQLWIQLSQVWNLLLLRGSWKGPCITKLLLPLWNRSFTRIRTILQGYQVLHNSLIYEL